MDYSTTFWWSPYRSFLFCWRSLRSWCVLLTSNATSASSSYRTQWWWIRQRRQSCLDGWRSWSYFVNDMCTYVQQPSNNQSASLPCCVDTKLHQYIKTWIRSYKVLWHWKLHPCTMCTCHNNTTAITPSFTLPLAGMGSRQFCWGRGREVEAEARQGSNVLNRGEARRGRGRELEAEARQTKFEARPRRGDPWKTLLPLMYSNAKFGRFKSNCMTKGKWPRDPTLLGWGDLCHSSVWGFMGFKLELELRGRMLS